MNYSLIIFWSTNQEAQRPYIYSATIFYNLQGVFRDYFLPVSLATIGVSLGVQSRTSLPFWRLLQLFSFESFYSSMVRPFSSTRNILPCVSAMVNLPSSCSRAEVSFWISGGCMPLLLPARRHNEGWFRLLAVEATGRQRKFLLSSYLFPEALGFAKP